LLKQNIFRKEKVLLANRGYLSDKKLFVIFQINRLINIFEIFKNFAN
jgi:hypothetical protein